MSNGVEKVEIPDEYVVRNIYGEKAMKRALLVLVGLQGLQGGRAQGPGDSRDGGELGTTSWSMSTWTMMVWLIGFAAMVATIWHGADETEYLNVKEKTETDVTEKHYLKKVVKKLWLRTTPKWKKKTLVKQTVNVVQDTYTAVCQNAVTQKSGKNYIIFQEEEETRK